MLEHLIYVVFRVPVISTCDGVSTEFDIAGRVYGTYSFAEGATPQGGPAGAKRNATIQEFIRAEEWIFPVNLILNIRAKPLRIIPDSELIKEILGWGEPTKSKHRRNAGQYE